MAKQHGLEWVEQTYGLEPRWTKEPDIEKVELLARKYLKLDENDSCRVSFYAQGAFNKLYKIQTEAKCFLMRVTLPVDPVHKTSSEVATVNFVRLNTDIPAPRILSFDDSAENELGFEWILEEMLPGTTLHKRWRTLQEDAKRKLVKQIAGYQAQLFRHKFTSIGNIFDNPTSLGTDILTDILPMESTSSTISVGVRQPHQESDRTIPAPGRIVSMSFFWSNHIKQDVERGPFANSAGWMHARLNYTLTDQDEIIKSSDDEDEIEDAQNCKDVAERLLKLLPLSFPSEVDGQEPTTLLHDDLNMTNILVNFEGEITGVVDWECVSTLPLYKSCQFPDFLIGRDRIERPEKDGYGPDYDEDDAVETEKEEVGELEKDELDNEGKTILYWEHMLEYEQTLLRGVFLEEMARLTPDWVAEFEKGSFKADFEAAVENSGNVLCMKRIQRWLDAIDRGETMNLRKSFVE